MKKLLFPILILAAATCCTPGTSLSCGCTLPTVVTFNANPSTIISGDTSKLNWEVSGATQVTIDNGIGNVALSGDRAVTPNTTTTYTLTATNAGGKVTTATTQVVVSASSTAPVVPTPITPPISPSAGDLPSIDLFIANPSFITTGGTTTLKWIVSNATAVTINPGVGSFGLTGTAPVSPPVTTDYILTATNDIGYYAAQVTVVVASAPPPTGKPDLVITDISRSGSTINYIIKNQGEATAGTSVSELTIDYVAKASDTVGPLNAGASSSESFSFYYDCSGTSDSVAVRADRDGAVTESNEGNNAYSESWTCLLQIQPGPVFPVLGKPDLVVTDIWVFFGAIDCKITNQGTKDSVVCTAQLYVSGILRESKLVPVIAKGASQELYFNYNFQCSPSTQKNVEVRIDTGNTNAESNEGNNSRSEMLTCQ